MSIPFNAGSFDVRPLSRSGIETPNSRKNSIDERVQGLTPWALPAGELASPNLASTSSRRQSTINSSSASSGSFLFSPCSVNSFGSVDNQRITPEVDEELIHLVEGKLGSLLPESLPILRLVAFLKKNENQGMLQAFQNNKPFEINKLADLQELGLTYAFEFVPSGSRYRIIEVPGEGDVGCFLGTGAKKRVIVARERSIQGGALNISRVARQLMGLTKANIPELTEIVKRHKIASELADSGLLLVASKAYFIASKLLIIQPLAPSLATELTQGITQAQATKMLLDVSRGIAGLHERGYAHRDLKPDNIGNVGRGACREDRYYLNDFDVLLLNGPRKKEEEPVGAGTPTYMSPEACRGGGAYDLIASDIWSFGISALQILFSTETVDPKTPFPLHPFIEVANSESQGLLHSLGTLKDEAGIDAYFARCVTEKHHLEGIYRLVKETLYLDPTKRMPMAVFHERLAALSQ